VPPPIETKPPVPLLHLQSVGSGLSIVVGERLRDRVWAERFGEIQESLVKPAGRQLTLDLRLTRWADPNPLLALAIAVEMWRRAGGSVVIALADPSTDPDQGAMLAAFLVFLEREGFLALFAGVRGGPDEAIAHGTTIRFGAETFDDLVTLRSHLFTRSPILPIPVVPAIHAHLFDMSEMSGDEAVSELADALVAEAESGGLKRHFDRDVYSDPTTSASPLGARELSPAVLVEDIRQIFIELLENVKEHAYGAADPPHLAAVYARFRLGLQDPRAGHLRRELIKLHEDEVRECPRVGQAVEVTLGGFMEIFLADAGIGLSTHLAQVLPRRSRPGERKHSLKAFFDRLWSGKCFSNHGDRAQREKDHRSPLPGLQHVTTLLSRGHGLFRALDKLEWAGAECRPPKSERGASEQRDAQISESVSSDRPVRGTHILIRASTGEPKQLEAPWSAAVLAPGAAASTDATLHAWIDRASARAAWCRVVFQAIDEEQGRWRDAEGKERRELGVGDAGDPYRCVLWRPARSLRRNDIQQALQRIGSDGVAHVIIADQDIATAMMTASTLDGMVLAGAPDLRTVSIVSYNLAAVDLVAKPRKGRPGTRLSLRHSELLSTQPGANLSLPHVISALRDLDGALFWAAVRRHDEKMHLLLPGPIRWSRTQPADDDDFKLGVHLDFTQVLHVKLCRWVCRRALSRFLSYCSPSDAPAPVDHLIDPLINSFLYSNNTDYHPQPAGVRPSVLLGSVLMSWSSLRRRRSLAEVGERQRHPIIAHLLQHPRLPEPSKAGDLALSLISWANGTTSLKPRRLAQGASLQRITDTPVVGPGGTGYWRAYRREQSGSLYGVSPDRPQGISVGESYGFWQSRGLLRLGHWHHGSSHDFVGVDLLTAIRGGRVNLRGMVWTFLRGHLLRIADDYQGKAPFARCHLLACVPNEGTNLILNRAFEALPWLQDKTVYLPLVQRQRSAMRLRLSPIALEAARERIQAERRSAGGAERVRVLVLDTYFGDVRTFFELINTVREIGADEVETLALLDRSRLPTDAISFRHGWHHRHARLWRLDVDALSPSLGPRASAGCPLCGALEMVINAREDVPERMETTRRRLAFWIEAVRVRTLSKASPLAGLPAVRLPHPISLGFGHDIEAPGREDIVQVFEAAALASILLEAVTITGMHETVQRTLDEVERTATSPRDNASESTRVAARLAARLYVLIGQALLMRHDSELDRRVIYYRSLLDALFDSRWPTPATAFGAIVLATADDTILRSLMPDIERYLAERRPDIDLALALAMMARRYDRLRRVPSVAAFLVLLGGARDGVPRMLREIFLIVGSRDGAAHAALLHQVLEKPVGANRESTQTALSMVEGLTEHLRSLQELESWLPRNGSKERMTAWMRSLGKAAQALRAASSATLDRAWEDLRLAVYGEGAAGGGIYHQIQQTFSVNAGQIERLVMEVLQRNGQSGSAASDLIEREGQRNFEAKLVAKVRAIRLLPIEDCIFELFDNAKRYAREPFSGAAALVRWSCRVVDDAIEIEIRNLCEEHPAISRPSLNQYFLESLGGWVKPEVRLGAQGWEFVSCMRLPTLAGLVAVS
jgi:hypothetical protein